MDIEKSFQSTSKILFGTEIGALGEFEKYLLLMIDAPLEVKSTLSGNDVYLSQHGYCRDARFISLDEIGRLPVNTALSINEIKDIDSLFAAVKERLYYCGNNIIGNSMQVKKSDSCADAVFVLNSHQIISSKYVSYSYGIRAGEHVHGCMWCGEVSFSIRSHGIFKSTLCWDSYLAINSRALYSSFNCRSCSDMLFSFNQVAKHYMIGNLELQHDRYDSLKQKLMAEIAEELRRKKRFPSLFELMMTPKGDQNG